MGEPCGRRDAFHLWPWILGAGPRCKKRCKKRVHCNDSKRRSWLPSLPDRCPISVASPMHRAEPPSLSPWRLNDISHPLSRHGGAWTGRSGRHRPGCTRNPHVGRDHRQGPRPDGLLERLGRRRTNQRLHCLGWRRGKATLRRDDPAREAQRHCRSGVSRGGREVCRPRLRWRRGPHLDQRPQLSGHEGQGLAARPLHAADAELPLRGHRGQAQHGGRLHRAGGRHGVSLALGATGLCVRQRTRQATRPAALGARAARLGQGQPGALDAPHGAQLPGGHLHEAGLVRAHAVGRRFAEPRHRRQLCAGHRAAVGLVRRAAPAPVAPGPRVPGERCRAKTIVERRRGRHDGLVQPVGGGHVHRQEAAAAPRAACS